MKPLDLMSREELVATLKRIIVIIHEDDGDDRIVGSDAATERDLDKFDRIDHLIRGAS